MFIYENGGGIYHRSTISRRMKELKLTKVRASTEAYQAFSPRSLFRERLLFFTEAPPLGIVGRVRRRQLLIDVDECGISLERCNRKYGHSAIGFRVRKPGHYTRDTKLTVILLAMIEPGNPQVPPAHLDGSLERPRRWAWVRETPGTDAWLFADFCNHVCSSMEADVAAGRTQDELRYFLWDNLSSHHAPLVHHTVEEGRPGSIQFRIIPRPPYKPKYGPTEYAFCELVDLNNVLKKIGIL